MKPPSKGAVINFTKQHGKKTNTFWFDTVIMEGHSYLVFVHRRTREHSFMYWNGECWRKGIGMGDYTLPQVYPYDLPIRSPEFYHHDIQRQDL